MAGLARPMLRCLREDLALTVPRADSRWRESATRSWLRPTSASSTTRRRTNGSPPSAPCRPSWAGGPTSRQRQHAPYVTAW